MARTCIVAVLVVLGTLTAVCVAAEQDDPYDSPGLQQACAMAADAGKPVLIHFYSPG